MIVMPVKVVCFNESKSPTFLEKSNSRKVKFVSKSLKTFRLFAKKILVFVIIVFANC